VNRTVLITGANGFVGSHIVDALLRNGYAVRAMVRTTSDLTFLEEKPVELVHGTLGDRESLANAVKGADLVVHNAGVVSEPKAELYYRHNTEGTRNLYEAARRHAPEIRRFLYVSSQAAGGPTRGDGLRRESDREITITDYGRSKLLAERWLLQQQGPPVTIVRPPAVYGPRDRAFLPLFKMIAAGWVVRVGRKHEVSLVHVQDLARQVMLQLEHENAPGEVFYCAPNEPVLQEEFSGAIGAVLGTAPRALSLPPVLLKVGYPVLYPMLNMLGDPPFRPDKLPDLIEPRWTVSGDKAKALLGFDGVLPLEAGVGQTAEWYRWKGWLKTRRDRIRARGTVKVQKRKTSSGTRRYSPDCDLCGLAFDGELKTKKHYEDENIIIVDCLICRVPMAVLKEHRSSFTDEEKARLERMFSDLFGEGHCPDWEQRRIPEHAHVHVRGCDGVKPWQQRPDDAGEQG
jgi:nucleoside-diphosphate-sugar epimerase